jgi:hypothetical protein
MVVARFQALNSFAAGFFSCERDMEANPTGRAAERGSEEG